MRTCGAPLVAGPGAVCTMKMSPDAGSTSWLPGSPSLSFTQLAVPVPRHAVLGAALINGAKVRPLWETVSTSWLLPLGSELATASYSSYRLRLPPARVPLCAYHIRSTGVLGAAAQLVVNDVPWSVDTLFDRLVKPCRSEKNMAPFASSCSSVSPPPTHVVGLPGPICPGTSLYVSPVSRDWEMKLMVVENPKGVLVKIRCPSSAGGA